MTTVADLLRPADRDRILARLAEWRDLDGAMRQPGGMPAVPEPPALHQMATARGPRTSPHTRGGAAPTKGVTSKMTEPRTQFEGEWANGSQAVIDVAQSGLRVSISAQGGWPELQDAEMLFTPREAVKLAHALLTIAAPQTGAASQIGVKWTGADRGQQTGWLFDADLLT